MFKLIVIIDCDICHDSFDRVALSTDRGPAAWEYLVADLRMRAETCGWDLYRQDICNACQTDVYNEADSSKRAQGSIPDDCPF